MLDRVLESISRILFRVHKGYSAARRRCGPKRPEAPTVHDVGALSKPRSVVVSPNAYFTAAPPLPPGQARRTLRVLCLHGHGSNSDITTLQLGNMGLLPRLSVDFLHAPFAAGAQSAMFAAFTDKPFHTWWEEPLTSAGLGQSLRYVLRHIAESGPYDGLYGFSMGAAVASLLSFPGMPEALGVPLPPGRRPWSFVVCACGVALGLPEAKELIGTAADAPEPGAPLLDSTRIQRRSLHLIGRWDVCRSSSRELAELYSEPTTYVHDFGHELPAGVQTDKTLMSLRDAFFQEQASAI